jgi:DNA-binding NarL/FixJ family response regulator
MTDLEGFHEPVTLNSESQSSIYYIGSNPLAAEYVLELFGRSLTNVPRAFNNIIELMSQVSGPVIFIFDNCCLLPPIGECLRQLQRRYPDASYIVIDSHWSDTETIQMLALGIHGVLKHEQVSENLVEAVDAVRQGRIWAPEEILQRYIRRTAAYAFPARHELDLPTPREIQVLELARERFTNKEMGEMLGVQESTIKFHLSNIYSKLQIVNRLQLTAADKRSRCWSIQAVARSA